MSLLPPTSSTFYDKLTHNGKTCLVRKLRFGVPYFKLQCKPVIILCVTLVVSKSLKVSGVPNIMTQVLLSQSSKF